MFQGAATFGITGLVNVEASRASTPGLASSESCPCTSALPVAQTTHPSWRTPVHPLRPPSESASQHPLHVPSVPGITVYVQFSFLSKTGPGHRVHGFSGWLAGWWVRWHWRQESGILRWRGQGASLGPACQLWGAAVPSVPLLMLTSQDVLPPSVPQPQGPAPRPCFEVAQVALLPPDHLC